MATLFLPQCFIARNRLHIFGTNHSIRNIAVFAARMLRGEFREPLDGPIGVMPGRRVLTRGSTRARAVSVVAAARSGPVHERRPSVRAFRSRLSRGNPFLPHVRRRGHPPPHAERDRDCRGNRSASNARLIRRGRGPPIFQSTQIVYSKPPTDGALPDPVGTFNVVHMSFDTEDGHQTVGSTDPQRARLGTAWTSRFSLIRRCVTWRSAHDMARARGRLGSKA